MTPVTRSSAFLISDFRSTELAGARKATHASSSRPLALSPVESASSLSCLPPRVSSTACLTLKQAVVLRLAGAAGSTVQNLLNWLQEDAVYFMLLVLIHPPHELKV